jgi:hypothetical protein
VLTNSVITWVTEYYQLAVQDLRAKGMKLGFSLQLITVRRDR